MSKKLSSSAALFYACAALSLLTVAVFWPVSQFEFQAYDDQRYVAANPVIAAGLTQRGLAWVFDFHVSNWHPLTWISHMLDVQLFGMNAAAHHLTNLLFHTANVILLLIVLNRATGALWRSVFVAGLFAIHPMHVESVAWIAERKDVLSTFFFMLTLWAYTRYTESKSQGPTSKVQSPKPAAGELARIEKRDTASACHARARLNYSLALLFFAFGLLSKPMLVTLPFLLLLLDYWPLERLPIANQKSQIKNLLPLLLEKAPFFLLAIGSCILTFLAQQTGGSVASLQLFSFESRIANALAAYAGYLAKLIWPAKLAVLYLPPEHWPVAHLFAAATLLLTLTAAAIWQARLRPYFVVGWLWFLGTLVPVIGLVQVGSQYMADRYSYVPFIGCFIAVAWAGWEMMTRQKLGANHLSETDPSPLPSPLTRGEGERDAAASVAGLRHADDAVRSSTSRIVLWGASLLVLLGAAMASSHQLESWRTPESLFQNCIQVTASNYVAYNNLGAILANQRKYDEAKRYYQEALRINPRFAEAVVNMGTLLALQGDITNALVTLQEGVRLDPGSGDAYGKLAVTLAEQGRLGEAVSCYRESLRLKPDQVAACNNLAWILATHPNPHLRNGLEAVRLAEHACELTGNKEPILVGTLAAAYAEAGRFSEAVSTAEKATSLANAKGEPELARKNDDLVQLYRKGEPYREAAGARDASK